MYKEYRFSRSSEIKKFFRFSRKNFLFLLPTGFFRAIFARNVLKDFIKKRAILALADGSVFEGQGFGACAKTRGEVVFNTGLVGYVESVTDPSYHGQILCQTYPLIGNYGVNRNSFESDRPWIAGYIVQEACSAPSHVDSVRSLDSWLREAGIPGISGVDTRALTKQLRSQGVMPGVLVVSTLPINPSKIRAEARSLKNLNNRDLVGDVTTREIRIYNHSSVITVALIDCGVKKSIIKSLTARGLAVVRVPADTPFEKIMSFSPRAVVISNGPGDPELAQKTLVTIKKLIQNTNLPVMGICLGHQLLALATGAKTYKLKFGHRSQNQPCLEAQTGRCYITSQNHGYAVRTETLPSGWETWFTNANDGTNEGIKHKSRPWFGIQFHPEAHPGPTDTDFLFDLFLEKVL